MPVNAFRLNDMRDLLGDLLDDIRLMGSLVWLMENDKFDNAKGLEILGDIAHHWHPMAMFAYSDEPGPYIRSPTDIEAAIQSFRRRVKDQNK
jgi:hypothetical protein